jgi:hypothetical protein
VHGPAALRHRTSLVQARSCVGAGFWSREGRHRDIGWATCRMRPSLLLSSAVLLGSHAFAWIALLPSFQGPKCRAQALGQSMRSSPALLCRPRGGGERQEPLPEGMISDRLAFSPAATAAGGVRQPHARLSTLGSRECS